ncbi:hypothetical protein [Sciscionella marina]|uniref:hypothetical protein n=1 Tax=Sciscionella marina TaxID=508770 RepID=UPI00035C8AEF|nr:hypothetical protein [Sciscionella marina]
MVRKQGLTIGAGIATLALLAGCGSANENAMQHPGNNAANADLSNTFRDVATLVDTVSYKQNTAKTSKVKLSGNVMGQQLTGQGAIDLSNIGSPAMNMTVNAIGKQMSMVFKNKAMYVHLPKPERAAADKSWAKIDANGNDPLSKTMGKIFTQMGDSADPSKTLERIKSTGRLMGAKQESVNGQRTTHYTIRMDTRKLFKQQVDELSKSLGSGMPKQAEQELNKSTARMPKTMPADLWLNEGQLPVKFTMTLPSANTVGGHATPVKVNANYSDWGKPVSIQAPARNQVTDFGAMLRAELGKLSMAMPRGGK